ncbi:MAG TPA: hypothetical protein VGA03_09155, partial [Anaerolineales bacterium]
FLANLFPFLGIQFMNLFRGAKHPGGWYVLPIFWILLGIIYGTNSLVFVGEPIPFSISVLWQRTGYMELLAYTFGFEASRNWALWEGFFRSRRIEGAKWDPQVQDWLYWTAGLLLLVLAAVREVSR